MPSGASAEGKETLRWVRIVGWVGVRGMRERSSRLGWVVGMVMAGGARNIVFSTLARTRRSRRERRRKRMGEIEKVLGAKSIVVLERANALIEARWVGMEKNQHILS